MVVNVMNTKRKQKENDKICYSNKNIGFSILLPDNWLEVKKSSYQDLGINDNTLFIFVVDKFTSITAIFSGFSDVKTFRRLFEKIPFDEKLKILNTGEKEINNLIIKYVINEFNDKKILNCFCLINGMVINFTINIDLKNKLSKDKLLTDENARTLFELLGTIKITKPINPPIYVENVVEETKTEISDSQEVMHKQAQINVELDCKYKHSLIPNFYLKYIDEEKNSILSVIDQEIYVDGFADKVRLVKIDAQLADKIIKVIDTHIQELMKMDVGYNKPKSTSIFTIKLNDQYLLIDLLDKNNDKELLQMVINQILAEIPELKTANSKQNSGKISEAVYLETKTVLNKIREERNRAMQNISQDKKIVSDKVGKEAQEILEKIKARKEEKDLPKNDSEHPGLISDAVGLEARQVLAKIRERQQEEQKVATQKYISNEANTVLNKLRNDKVREEYQDDEEERTYDLSEFEEFFHNINGHSSFKFLFPKDSGQKVDREFNVFDIVKNDDLEYRIFLFKCENEEKYEAKLNDWMEKNLQTSNAEIKVNYENKTKSSLNIKTYILSNDRFYKTAYIGDYLVAISGYADKDKLFYSDLALESLEIGEDNREFVEAQNRKNRSINILKEQGISYIDELPAIVSSYEVTGKTLEEIAKRAIVLCIVCNYASDIVSSRKKRYLKNSKKFFTKLLDKFNVKDAMTKEEKELFEKNDKNLAIQISWQFEGCLVLLWTLGIIDEIGYPDTLVDADLITSAVSSCETFKEFIEKCELRDVNEVLDLADLTYRYNWYCVETKINNEDSVINREIVMERHRAFKWLISDEKWDKVEINT